MARVNVLDDPDDIYDLNKRAESSLQDSLNAEVAEALSEDADQALVAAELRKKKILKAESNRVLSRVLFVVSDPQFLNEAALEAEYGELSSVFDEVHILLVMSHKRRSLPTKRLSKNVWRYMASSRLRFTRPHAAMRVVKNELTFGDGFRPDIVVATDPFMAGVVAQKIAEEYDRPWQLHVRSVAFLEDTTYKDKSSEHKWNADIAADVIEAAPSIRCKHERICDTLKRTYALTEDISTLPKYFNLSHLLTVQEQEAAAEPMFPQFSVTVMYIGRLDSASLLHQVLDATRFLLQTPGVGLVVLGTGPSQQKFRERAALLGIAEKILFLGEPEAQNAALAQADIVIIPETTQEADERAITAAALGTPVLAAKDELRETLFDDEESALLVPPGDVSMMTHKLKRFIDLNALRKSLSINAARTVRTQIVEDPELYHIAYRNAIEEVLYKKGRAQQEKEVGEVMKEELEKAEERRTTYQEKDGVVVKLPGGRK